MSKHGRQAKQNLNKMKESICCETLPHRLFKGTHGSFWTPRGREIINRNLSSSHRPSCDIVPLKVDKLLLALKLTQVKRLDICQYNLSAKLKLTESCSQKKRGGDEIKWSKCFEKVPVLSRHNLHTLSQLLLVSDKTELEHPVNTVYARIEVDGYKVLHVFLFFCFFFLFCFLFFPNCSPLHKIKTLSLCLPVISNIQDHVLLVLLMGVILK